MDWKAVVLLCMSVARRSEQAVWLVGSELLLAGQVLVLLVQVGRGMVAVGVEGQVLEGGGDSGGVGWWDSGVGAWLAVGAVGEGVV